MPATRAATVRNTYPLIAPRRPTTNVSPRSDLVAGVSAAAAVAGSPWADRSRSGTGSSSPRARSFGAAVWEWGIYAHECVRGDWEGVCRDGVPVGGRARVMSTLHECVFEGGRERRVLPGPDPTGKALRRDDCSRDGAV
jgi:hypothetical protein